MTTIRYVKEADYADWKAMVKDYDPSIPDPVVCWKKLFDIRRSEVRCFVAIVDEQVVGFAHFFPHETTFSQGQVCYLANLYVKPEFRRQGVARSLIDRVIEKAKERDWVRVYWVTENENPARPLYDSYVESDHVRYHINLKGFV